MRQDKAENEAAILAVSLTMRYPGAEEPALEDFSLEVARGEFFGLLGPNGAGKTTAISILCGLTRTESGTVRVLGLDLHEERHALRNRFGLVPQDLALYEQLTARENLTFFGRLHGLHGNALTRRISWCLEVAALEEHADRPVATCSGGMKRRLNLAAGLLNDPELVFLDEPTVGIDAQSRSLIHERLAALNRQGTTIIYTTHYMEEASELCSRIAIMDHGRLVIAGQPDALLRKSGCATLEDLFLDLTGRQLRDI